MFATKFRMANGDILQLSCTEDYELACAGLRDGAYIVLDGNETFPITVMFENFIFRLGRHVKIKDQFKNDCEKGKEIVYEITSLNEVTKRATIRPTVYQGAIVPSETVGLEMIVPIA